MTVITFDDFLEAANGGEKKSQSLENFFKKPEPLTKLKFPIFNLDPPAAGGVSDVNSGPNNVNEGESFKINFVLFL